MGSLLLNIPDIVVHEPRLGVRVSLTVHRQRGVTNMVGFKIQLHHGASNFNAELAETSDIGSVYDVLRYCKEPGHTARDGTFDAKMTAIWGTAYSGLSSAYKDDVFATLRAGEVIPPPL